MANQKSALAVPSHRKSRKKKSHKSVVIPPPLTPDEVTQLQLLPLLTLEQIGRVLQKPVEQVREITRTRAKRPIPTLKVGKNLCSTWAKLQQWIEEGFTERAA